MMRRFITRILNAELHELKLNNMTEIILKEESYQLIGVCMEVHRELGMGFKEIVYKDALEFELKMSERFRFLTYGN